MAFLRAGRNALRFSHNLPFARVSSKHLDRTTPLLSTAQGKTPSISQIPSSVVLSLVRTFADKPASRPKQHTGRTPARKSSAKTSTAKKSSKPTKAKKKTAAKKKKVAKKPKAKPKATTTKKAEADKLRALKATSLKTEEPKHRGPTAWIVFVTDRTKGVSSPVSERGELLRSLAGEFRSLSSGDREALNHRANASGQAVKEKYESWVASKNPLDIRTANFARIRLRKLKIRGYSKLQAIKDDRQVKQPKTALVYFTVDRHASGDMKKIPLPDASRLISREWKELPASEKQRFFDLEKSDRERYLREFKQVYGIDP